MPANDPKLPWWARSFLPELDAEGTDFCNYTPVPKPNAFDLDRLFYVEHVQLLHFGGLRVYEVLVLEQLEPYTPRLVLPKGLSGFNSSDESSENEEDTNEMYVNDDDDYSIDDEKGESSLFNTPNLSNPTPGPWVERDFVEVDETKWFKIFQRERWASYSHPDPKQLSVDIDNDRHWGKLSRVIEIANRILSEALDHEWISSFLDPRARDSRGPVPSGSGSDTWANTAIYRVVPLPPESRISREQARKTLDDVANHFFWGFHMPDEYPGVTGRTTNIQDQKGDLRHWMTLLLTSMEPVFKESTPEDPEGRQAAVGMAKTFYKEEKWAEAGYSFENAMFGTTAKDYWIDMGGRIQYIGMRGMNPPTCEDSLHYRYDNWSPDNPFLDVLLGIPAIFPCAMTTSDFWESHVKKYGYPSLRWSWVCEGKSEMSNETAQMWPAKIMDPPYKYSRYEELNRSMKAVAQKLRKRRLDLKRLRPWYAEEYALWCRTVYAETALRSTMMLMVTMLYGRSIKHEAVASTCIEKLLKPHNRLSDLEEISPKNRRVPQMFYQALGFLGQAALPVRTAPISYKDDSVGQYPDRLRPALRPNFAGTANFVDDLVRCGKGVTDSSRSKVLYSSNSPSHDKELCMSNARLSFLRWRLLGYVTASLVKEFGLEWQWMRRKLDQAPFDDVTLDWSHLTWRYLRNYSGEADHQSSSFFHAEKIPDQRSQGIDADLPAWAIARPAITSASSPAKPAAARIPFYSISEVGEHQRLESPVKWGCLWDGNEMAVYDITAMLPNGEWTFAMRANVTTPAPFFSCRKLRPDVIGQDCLRWLHGQPPVGYVVAPRSKEDIRINDGKLGKPRWIPFAADVFDITYIELETELQGLEAVFTGTASGDPVIEAVNRGYHPDVIQEALHPYNIGRIWNKLGEKHHRNHRVFTENEVKWHTTRETGIYTIIRGGVYDFTTLIDQHPGGSSIIEEVAGGDGTASWDKYHHDPQSIFGFDVHKQLKGLQIGSIVKEQGTKAVSSNEICIRDYIFSKDKFKADDKILNLLTGCWGTDATAEMEKQDPPEGYRQLLDCPHAITAKVVTPRDKLPYMNQKVLGGMNGKERPGGFNESYVSDGAYVYNLTSLLRYSKPTPFLDRLKLKAGSVLSKNRAQDDQMKQWLWKTNQHRIIALYRTPKHAHNSAEKPVAWKTSYRRTPSLTPKVTPNAGSSGATAGQTGPTPQPPTLFTVRPLYPLRKKQKKDKKDATENPYPKLNQLGLSDAAVSFPREMSRTITKTTLEQMGFPVDHGKRSCGQKRKRGQW
ncbi:cytochrome b5-like heme steroid binding domain-containing protein [Colletotrichum tofieldiae]|uniref:Cytochrome b5-like heme steroid binding domain-containing protein n=1 Tax=Colletotrichum tofieldiae TaxID=708197 RepID=A0A166YLV7_9PEZI|nr:cytochrome b5-like heme steroid binding domain-containing protein [Colletotrichum tofieldiae]